MKHKTMDAIRQAIVEVHEKQKNVGLAAKIEREGEDPFSFYLGFADLEHQVSVGPETRFGIASITKLFTAVTLLRLHASGIIDLDAPVQIYLPDFPEKPEGAITIRNLATHQSGLPHPQNRTPAFYATHYESAVDAVSVFVNDALLFPPGTERRYSSSNYNLLAAVIERVTGQLFTEVVQHEILSPLNLGDTCFDDVRYPLPRRARRYSYYDPWTYAENQTLMVVPIWDYSFNVGGGNMISTVDDLTLFGKALFTPGLLPQPQYDLLWDAQWFGRQDEQGRRHILATGGNPGVQSGLVIYPEEQLAAAILSNTWGIGSGSTELIDLPRFLFET